MGDYDDLVRMTEAGEAVLVDTPYGRAVQFVESPVEPDKRTPMTEADCLALAEEFEANQANWPSEMFGHEA